MVTVALILKEPRPVSYASKIPSWSTICPPVGKSGPGANFIKDFNVAFGFSIKAHVAATISPTLWGAILVAIPTAIPVAPLINKFGNADGSTRGS